MNVSQPIKNEAVLSNFRNYYYETKNNPRNYLLVVMGINTALRISDLLNIQWKDVINHSNNTFKNYIELNEKKTKKHKRILLNTSIISALNRLIESKNTSLENINEDEYIFCHSNNPHVKITRMQAYRIIKQAANACKIEEIISCHSLRKTFGYHARKKGIDVTVLVDIYNHSSYEVTKRYLGIDQDDIDEVYRIVNL